MVEPHHDFVFLNYSNPRKCVNPNYCDPQLLQATSYTTLQEYRGPLFMYLQRFVTDHPKFPMLTAVTSDTHLLAISV